MNLSQEAAHYSVTLAAYEAANKIPYGLFSNPDHIALKAGGIKQFETMVHDISGIADEMYCLDDKGRFVVAAKLAGSMAVGMHGRVRWLEIKEPQQSRTSEVVGVEHTEFFLPDFNGALAILKRKGLEPQVQSDGDHHRINLVFNSDRQELRLTDTPIAAIVSEKLEADEAYIIKQAA
jgi:hypothetical protein